MGHLHGSNVLKRLLKNACNSLDIVVLVVINFQLQILNIVVAVVFVSGICIVSVG